ncbi:MAG: hypothetical protein ACPH9T_09775, partial [Paracoccaceae bacterium]
MTMPRFEMYLMFAEKEDNNVETSEYEMVCWVNDPSNMIEVQSAANEVIQDHIEEAEKGDIITFYADIDYNGTQEVVTHYIYEIDESGEEPIIRTHRHFEYGEEIVPDTWLIKADDVIGT